MFVINALFKLQIFPGNQIQRPRIAKSALLPFPFCKESIIVANVVRSFVMLVHPLELSYLKLTNSMFECADLVRSLSKKKNNKHDEELGMIVGG
jgi:hypothetical protein